jgi:hypothetical protein
VGHDNKPIVRRIEADLEYEHSFTNEEPPYALALLNNARLDAIYGVRISSRSFFDLKLIFVIGL